MYVVKESWKGYWKKSNNGNIITDYRHCTRFKTRLGAFLFVLSLDKHWGKIEKEDK